jgi:hypothetical protein
MCCLGVWGGSNSNVTQADHYRQNCPFHIWLHNEKDTIKISLFFIFFDTHTKESSRFQKLRLFILALYRRSFFMKIRPLVAYLLILYVFSTLTIKIRISLYLL